MSKITISKLVMDRYTFHHVKSELSFKPPLLRTSMYSNVRAHTPRRESQLVCFRSQTEMF